MFRGMAEYTFSTYLSFDTENAEKVRLAINSIYKGLGQNIVEKTGKTDLGMPLRIFMQNELGETVGGIVGEMFGGWMYISLLWIEKSIRGKGHGTKLMKMAEEEAVRTGCKHIHLDTYSFEAKPFYERLGFEVFSKLDDYPPGHCKYFLKKSLG